MSLSISKIKLSLLVYLLIASLTFLVYFYSINNPFIWDDDALVVRNELIRDFKFLPLAFKSDFYYGVSSGSNFYRPLQTLSYILDYNFWQLDPRGYHITNILLQSIVSLLVFFLGLRFLKSLKVSLAAALLFAICPIHSEAVAYVSGRAEMLLGIFLILSLLLFIKGQSFKLKLRAVYLFLSLVFFTLGLLSKELALVFPFVILAYAFYFLRQELPRMSFFVKNILAFFIVDAVYLLLRLSLLDFATIRLPALARFPLILRITVLPKIIFTYLKLLLIPVDLHMSRELVRPTSFFGIFIAWFLLGLIVVSCIKLLKYNAKRKTASFMLFWSLVFCIPQSGIFPINAFISEHFIYLPSITFFMLIAYLLQRYLRKNLFKFAVSGLVLFYGALTFGRTVEWRSPTIFYERILKLAPDSFQAHNNLGLLYQKKNEFAKAISHYQKALEIMPDLIEARSNLADLYFKMGLLADAEREYLIVERTSPENKAGEVQNNIAALYETKGELDKAFSRYKLALSLDPGLNFSHFNIARIYLKDKDYQLAAERVLSSLSEIDVPEKDKPQILALILQALKAADDIKCAATFYNDLGVRLANGNFINAAVPSFKRAIELSFDYADAHFNLGLAYLKQGQKRQAIQELKIALKINPGHFQAKGLLLQAR